ncbi:MAG TPA: amino acid ABC transporter permease [Acidimicrobiales bacterium]|nr:amino acid ABC transporter permease [Acidimicrobiales bacterium]
MLLAMFVHLLVTAKSLQWGVVGHYLTASNILIGLTRTIYLTVIAMAAGIVIGTIVALMRQSRSALINGTAYAYIWFFRGTPLLVQIIFWYNIASFVPRVSLGIPFGPSFVSADVNRLVTPLVAAVLALGLNEGAYMSEIIRAGILSVDAGQMEAALALGMTKRLAMRRIVLRQAMRVVIPPTGNQTISMLKGTSLVSVISMAELLYSVQLIYNTTFQTIPLLVVASIWYLVLTTVLSVGQYYVERHLARSGSRPPPRSPIATINESLRRMFVGDHSQLRAEELAAAGKPGGSVALNDPEGAQLKGAQ